MQVRLRVVPRTQSRRWSRMGLRGREELRDQPTRTFVRCEFKSRATPSLALSLSFSLYVSSSMCFPHCLLLLSWSRMRALLWMFHLLIHGSATTTSSTPSRASVRHGYGTLAHESGTYVYTGTWSDGRPHGYGVTRESDGSMFEGAWTHESSRQRICTFGNGHWSRVPPVKRSLASGLSRSTHSVWVQICFEQSM